jgi:hypothetical protein
MNEIQKAIQNARASQVERIYGSFTNAKEVREVEENKITKGNEEENPFEKQASEEQIEKSDIMDSMNYSGNIKLSKTGKEIKTQVDEIILPELTASLAANKIEADKKIKDCGNAPTTEPDKWWTDGIKIDCGYKIYSWQETYVSREGSVAMDTFSNEDAKEKTVNAPSTQEEAKARIEYNDIVRVICNILVDIKACEILKGLKDDVDYELTPRQLVTFKF